MNRIGNASPTGAKPPMPQKPFSNNSPARIKPKKQTGDQVTLERRIGESQYRMFFTCASAHPSAPTEQRAGGPARAAD